MPSSRAPVVGSAQDAATEAALERSTMPLRLSAAGAFKAIFHLKRWAGATRQHMKACKKPKPKKAKSGNATSVAVLNARFGLMGMRMITVASDGNCQFRAVSHQLFGTEEHHREVRHRALEYIRAQKQQFACFCGDAHFERYLQKMERDRAWGDELTLRAISNAFGTRITVVTSAETAWLLRYEPDGASSPRKHCTKQCFLAYVAPVHYNAFELAHAPGPPPELALAAPCQQRAAAKRERGTSPKPKRAKRAKVADSTPGSGSSGPRRSSRRS